MCSSDLFTIDPADAAFQALAQGEAHTYSVAYGITDGIATTQTQVSFTVIGTNDAPIVTGPVTGTPNEDGQIVTVNATGNASDVDAHQGLQVTGVPGTLPAGVSFDAATGRFSLDPGDAAYQHLAKGETVDVVVNYNIYDGFVEVPTSVVFTVKGTNDVPQVAGIVQGGTVSEDGAPVAVNLLGLASDVDTSDQLTVKTAQGAAITTSVVAGSWTSPIAFTNANGVLTLDPAQFSALKAGESVTVQFNYTVTDGNPGGDAGAQAQIVVTEIGRAHV